MHGENYLRFHRDEPVHPVDDGVPEAADNGDSPTDWRGVAVLALLLAFIGYLLWLYR